MIFSFDTDHDPQIINDHELFVTAFRDGVWFPLTRLSNDQVADENPQWAKNRQNRSVPMLVWLKGTELSSTDEYFVNVNTRSLIRTNDYTSNLADFPILKLGERRTVLLNWKVLANASEVSIYAVVDPARIRPDSDRSNNAVSLALVRPDLAIADVYWEKLTRTMVSVTVRVTNLGVVQSTPGTVRLFRGSSSGAVLAAEPIEALPPGNSTEVNFLIDVINPGEDFEVSATLEETKGFDPSNNVAGVFVNQSAVTPPLRFGPLTFSPTAGARFSIQGEPGRLYRLETSPDLRAWSRLIEFIMLENSVTLTDEAAKSSRQRFYRVSEP